MAPHGRTARATCYNGRDRFILGLLQWGKRMQCGAWLGSGYSRGREKIYSREHGGWQRVAQDRQEISGGWKVLGTLT